MDFLCDTGQQQFNPGVGSFIFVVSAPIELTGATYSTR
jgi:hypothetical protein